MISDTAILLVLLLLIKIIKMANTTLNLYTFNCKNVNTSVLEINDLCNSHDFVFLQKTWMARAQLPTLSNINNEFVGYGLSLMNDEEQIHTGRPFGNIAVFMEKTLNNMHPVQQW